MRFIYGFLVLLTTTLLIILSSNSPALLHPDTEITRPDQGHTWIAFSSNRDGPGEAIYVMAPDGSDVHRLTDTSDNDSPVWSPDGNKIAFESLRAGHSQIYVMNSDGTNQVNVSNNLLDEDSPSWTPDSKQIVFESAADIDSEAQFYVMAVDGSNRHQIGGDLPIHAAGPILSPDGKQIAFVSRYGGWAIYVMDFNSKNVRKLVDEQFGPAWSPDNTFIASYGDLAHASRTIYVTNVRTGENRYLSNDYMFASSPSWSPDGQHIVFASKQGQSKYAQIYVMNSDGSQQVNISNNDFFDFDPSWSPVPVLIASFPMELTLIPTASITATVPCSCTKTDTTPGPEQSTLYAQASAIISTVTALAKEPTSPPTLHARHQLDATQTAIRGTLVIQRNNVFATMTATAKSTVRP